MKKLFMICALGASVTGLFAAPALDAEYAAVGYPKKSVNAVVTETLFHGRTGGLHPESKKVIIDMIIEAAAAQDVASANKLAATLKAFNPSAVFDENLYKTQTQPVLVKYNYPFGQAAGGYPARDFPAKL